MSVKIGLWIIMLLIDHHLKRNSLNLSFFCASQQNKTVYDSWIAFLASSFFSSKAARLL